MGEAADDDLGGGIVCCCSIKDARRGEGARGSAAKVLLAPSMLKVMPGLIDLRFSALLVGTPRPETPSPTPPVGDRVLLLLLKRDPPEAAKFELDCEALTPSPFAFGCCGVDDGPGVGLAVLDLAVRLSAERSRAMGCCSTAGEGGTLPPRLCAGEPVRGTGLAARIVASEAEECDCCADALGDIPRSVLALDGDPGLIAFARTLSEVEVLLVERPARLRASASSRSFSFRAARFNFASACRLLRATRSL